MANAVRRYEKTSQINYTKGMTIETEDGVYTFSGWSLDEEKDLTEEGLMEGNVTYRGYWTRSDIHIHTVDGKEIKFKPWTSDNSLPRASGNYYLTKDVTLTDNAFEPYSNTEINLCLNGHVIKQAAEGKRCINVLSYATFNLHDCNGDNCTHEGFVDSDGLWHLGTGDNAPTKDMKVGVTIQDGTGTFTKECSDYSANFTSDNSALKVVYEDGVLKLAPVVIPVPEISVSENDIVLNANGYTVDKLSLAYIGTEELIIDDWYTFENAGLQYKGINGSIGYKQYETPADGFTAPQHTTGYYAAYIRYIENGEKVVRYQVVYVDAAKSTPEIKASRNCIVLESNGFTVEKLSLAYIGPEKKLINDWESFEKAGLMYKDVNGSLGYKQYESPEEGKIIPQTTPGYYAAYIRFIENGQATVIYQVVYVNVEIALPEIQVSKNSIIFHTNDYAVEKLSLAYIGPEKLLINDWDSFANAGLKYTDINGSLGYKQYESPTDGKSYPQHTTGYYAAYIRYIDNGVQMVRYQVVYVDAEKSSIDPIVKPTKDDTPTEPTTPSSATTSESTNPANPDTGDTENIVLWIVAFAASSTVFAVCLIYGRKKKKAE